MRFLRGRVLGFVALAWSVSRPAAAEPTEPLSLTSPLQTAADCRYCHQNANASEHANDPPYGAFQSWQGSMMGQTARDPVFWAAVALAAQDDPEHTQECVRCHAPRAWLSGRGDAISLDELEEDDRVGVDCEVCHRMVADAATPAGNALYQIDDEPVDGDGRVARRGPWDYTDGVPDPADGETHPMLYDPYVGSSRLCGTCHDVSTPTERVDENGESMGVPFNEQRTYSEWLGSAFAREGTEDYRTCQDCHMPALADKPGCSKHVDVHAHPTGGRRHDLLGANRFMLELLRDGDVGASLGKFYFDNSIALMDEFLATAASLEVTAPAMVDLREGLAGLEVTVTNETGHKLPSGYSEGRRMWIEVAARYGDTVVWSSGLWDPEQGLQEDDQLRTYEGIAVEQATGVRNHLLRNDFWVVDSRIPPRGLQPNPETDPVGDRYTLQEDGAWPHWDTVAYAFPAAEGVVDATPAEAGDDQLALSVRLLYLINTREYIEQLADDNEGNDPRTMEAGQSLVDAFAEKGWAYPVVLAEQQLSVPVTGLAAPAEGTSGSSGDGAAPPGTTGGESTTAAPADDSSTGGGSLTDALGALGPAGCACRSQGAAPDPRGTLLLLGFVPLAWVASRRRRR